MNKFVIGSSILVLVMAGCSSHDDVLEMQSTDMLYASVDGASKVEIQDNHRVLWSAADKFRAFDTTGASADYMLVGEGNVASGQFVRIQGEAGTLVRAFFPLEDSQNAEPSFTDNKFTFKIQKLYNVNENSQNLPLLGAIDGNRVSFRHLFGVLRLDLTGVAETYRRVEIETDQVICGKYTLDLSVPNGQPVASNSSDKYKTVAIDRKAGESIYYLPLPPASYGFIKIYVVDTEGKRTLKIHMMNKLVQKGHLYKANLGSSLPLLYPILNTRANPQEVVVTPDQIIDNEWVAVGIQKRDYAIQRDSSNLFNGRSSYCFELKGKEDNSLDGYGGKSKGRAELCYSYATAEDFSRYTNDFYQQKQQLKTVYLYGKGHCNQGDKMHYTFVFRLPSTVSPNIHTIFAQWHGMPKRNLVYNADLKQEQMLTDQEFINLGQTMIFKKDKGYDIVTKQPNGWYCEQGGYPPLAFGFTDGFFYIQANSDKKWLSDKDERCNINPSRAEIGDVNTTAYKSSTLAYKLAMTDFPKDTWVTFDIDVDWSTYVYGKNEMSAAGSLVVNMKYLQDGQTVNKQIVNMPSVKIGRNDDDGYYFKFGIYRTDGNTVPVRYNLAGYGESVR